MKKLMIEIFVFCFDRWTREKNPCKLKNKKESLRFKVGASSCKKKMKMINEEVLTNFLSNYIYFDFNYIYNNYTLFYILKKTILFTIRSLNIKM